VNQDTLAVDVIRRVGILGNFLADEHTIRHMRDTYWHSRIFNNESFDAWVARGAKDVYQRAHEEVERILAAHYPPELAVTEDVKEALDEVMQECFAHLEWFQPERHRYH